MAGFLRKFATNNKKTAAVDVAAALPSKPITDAPPTLPPLFARFATSTLAEPDFISSPIAKDLIPDDNTEWNAWKALIDPIPVSTPDPPPSPPPPPMPKKELVNAPPLPVTRRKYTGPGLPAKQIKVSHENTFSDTSRASPSPRTTHAVSTRQDRNQQHTISATPSTFRDSAVVIPLLSPVKDTRPSPEQDLITKQPRGSALPSSYSLDNQVLSYPPLNIRHAPPASQDLPSLPHLQSVVPLQKPASTSSHTSSTTQSSSGRSDATHITNAGSSSTPFTSTSSIAPAIKVKFTDLTFHLRLFGMRSRRRC
ncbi:hypothetical protein K503DRAFT_373226 [Rhizopogon vinicolor AM-OR11-026]|uniref:Uncharacterized protein n=1 Tax=Rhizopogon vinicolor AM-OR11-026 TaxID=1314800 RepID=A0A1B7MRV8_9AGAM|nr:hypothetical protein K503DRAFT_373226 [Rhizopogon vinicolor AM-OR11-026]